MQIASAGPLPAASDVATALRTAAERLAHQPAVTVLTAHGDRYEQGFASLAQWAAKGAHLLEADLLLEPGDRLRLVGPPGWLPAAVCLAAWWTGLVVTVDGEADAAVVHEAHAVPDVAEWLSWGDAVDGSPGAGVGAEPWPEAVQSFPDQPPPPRAGGELAALRVPGHEWTQAELLDEAERFGLDGALGVDPEVPPAVWVPAVAVRPLRAGRPTVLAPAGQRAVAEEQERVARWAE